MAQVIWNPDIDVYDTHVIPLPVAENIAKYLCVQDLLAFGEVSRNTRKTVDNPKLWVSKLKEMGLWDNAYPTSEKRRINLNDLNPLTCMNEIIKSTKAAKVQVLKIYKCLNSYYSDLILHKPYDKLNIFKDFQTPEDQATILTNLLVYNRIDYDPHSSMVIRDKINALFEIFENALLRELEIHYDLQDYAKTKRFVKILTQLKNEQTLIDFFLQKSVFDNEEIGIFDFDSFDPSNFYKVSSLETKDVSFQIDFGMFENMIDSIANLFNYESEIIDSIFSQEIPMMYKVAEELVANRLLELFMALIDKSKELKLYLQTVPYLYELLVSRFIHKLSKSDNAGPSYHQLVRELVDMMYESFVAEYMREELLAFKSSASHSIDRWRESLSRREEETSKSILKHVKVETKHDFLSSFRKVFTINSQNNNNEAEEEEQSYSEIQAKTIILSENLKSMNQVLSINIVMDILGDAKIALQRLLNFREYTIAALKDDILETIQEVFINVINSIGDEHLRLGFETALKYLQDYNPSKIKPNLSEKGTAIAPLVVFCELINMADMIIQMIDIFYKEEMLHKHIIKHENSVLNPALQNKKKLEGLVDTYVADGLNVGINVLMSEVENTFATGLKKSYYNPPEGSLIFDGGTDVARKVVNILEDNFDLLVGCTDTSIVEVYQQEIAERLFQVVVKTLKNTTISVTGAINLISDLNLYYDFIINHVKANKRMIFPLFQALKKVGSIYLIDGSDSKAIGKLVSDLSKFNGIFGQEEIYEFVQRREDWLLVRKDVEKVMYGLSLGDCIII